MNSPAAHMPVPVHNPVDAALETAQRRAVVAAALSWIGTPYRQMCAVKGATGGIDCSMLLVRSWIEGRVFEEFDPRPYPSNWMLHRSEERYLGWLDAIGTRTETPKPGDVIAFQFGRCTSHAGILVENNQIVHAFAQERLCTKTPLSWNVLAKRRTYSFDMWGRIRGIS